MLVTIMNPGVIAPSHMPRTNRQAKRPPKLLQAACDISAIDQMKIHTLGRVDIQFDTSCRDHGDSVPHPFPHREALESKILRIFESEIAQV